MMRKVAYALVFLCLSFTNSFAEWEFMEEGENEDKLGILSATSKNEDYTLVYTCYEDIRETTFSLRTDNVQKLLQNKSFPVEARFDGKDLFKGETKIFNENYLFMFDLENNKKEVSDFLQALKTVNKTVEFIINKEIVLFPVNRSEIDNFFQSCDVENTFKK